MPTNNILNINSIENELNTALNYSAWDFDRNQSTHFLELNIKNNIESSINSWFSNLNSQNSNCTTCPPGTGFKVTLGLQILISYKVRFKPDRLGYTTISNRR